MMNTTNQIGKEKMTDTMLKLTEQGVWRAITDRLPGNDVALLDVIDRHRSATGEAGVRMTAISEALGISKPAATQAVERLCRKGFVARINGCDRRTVYVAMTEEGASYYRLRRDETDRLADRITRRMGEAEAAEFGRLLCSFSDALLTEIG